VSVLVGGKNAGNFLSTEIDNFWPSEIASFKPTEGLNEPFFWDEKPFSDVGTTPKRTKLVGGQT